MTKINKNNEPTFDNLKKRLQTPHGKSLYNFYRIVASGERHPTNPPLPENTIVLAAQAMCILIKHFNPDEEF